MTAPPDTHGARSLTRADVDAVPDSVAVAPTDYRTETLLVPVADERVMPALRAIAAAAGLELEVAERHRRLVEVLGADDADLVTATPVRFVDRTAPGRSPDAWRLWREAVVAEAQADGVQALLAVHLDHVIGTTPLPGSSRDFVGRRGRIRGNGLSIEGHGLSIEGHGLSIEGHVDTPDRIPTTWVGTRPRRLLPEHLEGRRPVAVVLDTGCSDDHPWFAGGDVVRHDLAIDGVLAGFERPVAPDGTPLPRDCGHDADHSADPGAPLDGRLPSHAGHGTFIAGLLLQMCPDVEIEAVPVMTSDGVVLETDLLHALITVAALVSRYREGREGGRAVDVVVLSFGYRHERAEDALESAPLRAVLRKLRGMGVTVVCSAGNGGTVEPLYPAAFSLDAGDDETTFAPHLAVGSLNPNSTTSMFSNSGDWVTDWQPGGALVSTVSRQLRGSLQPAVSYVGPGDFVRETIDPDDFSSGFAVWGGTSFAAPVLAGALLQSIWEQDGGLVGLPPGPADGDDTGSAVQRGRAAVQAVHAAQVEEGLARRQRSPRAEDAR